VLDDLIERHDTGAVFTVDPIVDDSGETFRWIVRIDGEEDQDVDARVRPDPDRPDVMVMLLVHGGEELELQRWSIVKQPYGQPVLTTLGELSRRSQ
jgi:hypothetical protein